jgi:hypothetical protein
MDWSSLLLVAVLLLLAALPHAAGRRGRRPGAPPGTPPAPPPSTAARLVQEAEEQELRDVQVAHDRRDDSLVERERAAMRARR